MRNLHKTVCRSLRNKAIKLSKYTEDDGQIDTVNMKFINSNSKRLGKIAKMKTNSYQNSAIIPYNVDTGSFKNILPFWVF